MSEEYITPTSTNTDDEAAILQQMAQLSEKIKREGLDVKVSLVAEEDLPYQCEYIATEESGEVECIAVKDNRQSVLFVCDGSHGTLRSALCAYWTAFWHHSCKSADILTKVRS